MRYSKILCSALFTAAYGYRVIQDDPNILKIELKHGDSPGFSLVHNPENDPGRHNTLYKAIVGRVVSPKAKEAKIHPGYKIDAICGISKKIDPIHGVILVETKYNTKGTAIVDFWDVRDQLSQAYLDLKHKEFHFLHIRMRKALTQTFVRRTNDTFHEARTKEQKAPIRSRFYRAKRSYSQECSVYDTDQTRTPPMFEIPFEHTIKPSPKKRGAKNKKTEAFTKKRKELEKRIKREIEHAKCNYNMMNVPGFPVGPMVTRQKGHTRNLSNPIEMTRR